MEDNKPLELNNVKIDDITFPFVQVYGLSVKDFRVDHNDKYDFGEGATVITDIDFDLVIIHLYDGQIEIDTHNKHWQSVSEQVKNYIMEDYEFMKQWQEREFAE